jgi:nitrogen fixation/metabolism regulation signal transduction histidine kinase
MKKIRSKIIFILILTVILPLIPISILVLTLVNQSYQIGVNPQVSRALENGLHFSKNLYDLQRRHLIETLERFLLSLSLSPDMPITRLSPNNLDINMDTTYWQIYSFQLRDKDGEQIWIKKYAGSPEVSFDRFILSQFQFPDQKSLVVSDRQKNLFTAVYLIKDRKDFDGFLVLQASMQEEFLTKAEQVLGIHQIFQSLDLARDSLMNSFLYTFIAIAVIFLSLAVFFGIWLSSRITSPISIIHRAATEIGQGNLAFRLPAAERKDEIGQLMIHFNEMAQQLQENQERLIYLQKIAAWQQMARKIAHEIKNPLTPIQLTLQQLIDQYHGSDKAYDKLLSECSHIINEEIGSLRQLVTQFSEFGRLPEFQPQIGELNALIREVSTLYGERLILQLDVNSVAFSFDPDRIRRILINLIENAIQANPADQPINIVTIYTADEIKLTVSDKGSGIAEEDLQQIFEPYFSTKKSGTGLGLAITRLIVEEHGGSISVKSQLAYGTVFTILLPLKQ